jgi:hypothetical protein
MQDLIASVLILITVAMIALILLALAATDNHLCKSEATKQARSDAYCAALAYWID